MAEYRRGPQREDNSGLWIVLGVVGGGLLLLVLVCGGAIYMITSAIRDTTQTMSQAGQEMAKQIGDLAREQQAEQQARQTARAFLDDCLAGRLNAAYEVTTAAFKKRFTQDQFKDLLAKHPVGPRAPLNLNEVLTFGLQRYRVTAAAPAGEPVLLTVTLAQDGNVWKVDQLTVDGPERMAP
jgi:hypothetical protein